MEYYSKVGWLEKNVVAKGHIRNTNIINKITLPKDSEEKS